MGVVVGWSPVVVDWLREAGLCPEGREVRRVIIDIQTEHPVKIYIEEYGTDAVFALNPPDLSDAVIERIEAPAPDLASLEDAP